MNKRTRDLLILCGILVLLLCAIISRAGKSRQSQPVAPPAPAQTTQVQTDTQTEPETTVEASETAVETRNDEDPANGIGLLIDYTSGDLNNYKRYYDSEANAFTVTFWSYGYHDASEDDPEKWEKIRTLVKEQCQDTVGSARKTDESVHVTFIVRNDDDLAFNLLIVEDGEITFDISAE